jgi:hypothetical protein
MVNHDVVTCRKVIATKNNIETTTQATYIIKKYLHTIQNENFATIGSIDSKYLLVEFIINSRKLAIRDTKNKNIFTTFFLIIRCN